MHLLKLDTLFLEFNQAGVRWCALRLPSGTGKADGDVDILIHPDDIPITRKVLQNLDFTQLPGWEPGLHYLHYDAPAAHWTWLHIVTDISFGRLSLLRTFSEAGCLERRQRQAEQFHLSPGDAFWILLLHCLLDKRKISLQHRLEIQQLARETQGDSDLAAFVQAVCPPGWTAERMVQLACDGGWTELVGVSPSLTAAWRQKQKIGSFQILFRRSQLFLHKLQYFPRTRGLGVALLGPDGAGKSSVMSGIQSSFILPVRPVYMGLTGGLLPYADRLRLPFLVIPARIFIFWVRYLRACYHQLRGRLVIFDRYIYDSAVPTPYPLNRLQRLYRRIDGHILPPPDLVLILDAPGLVMYQRKGEYNPEMLEDWRQHFLALKQQIRQVEIVNTNRPLDQVHSDVIERIWRRYRLRWERKDSHP